MIESGVSEEAAKPLLEEAIRQELNAAVEKEAEAREGLVKEYLDARDALKASLKREQDARKSLEKANNDLADLKRQQAREAKMEKIDRRRQKIATELGKFGFSLEGSHVGESAAARRRRLRNARTDASISAKLSRAESGRYVHWTERRAA